MKEFLLDQNWQTNHNPGGSACSQKLSRDDVLIRESVMKKFWRFKDPEYGTPFNLLDNYIPLVVSNYSISFKLNNFSEYFTAMI